MATLHIVSTPIGNLSDLSERAAQVLRNVGTVYAEDTRRSRILLNHVDSSARLVSLHRHNEVARASTVTGQLDAGEDAALVSDAGTPLLSDPGEALVRAVVEKGHDVVAVPGPSAVITALVSSGLASVPFAFLGFVPRKGRERSEFLERVAQAAETTVFFESPERLDTLLRSLIEGCGEVRQVAVARELTKVHESVFRGTLGEALQFYSEERVRGEITVVLERLSVSAESEPLDRQAAECLARALIDSGLTGRAAAAEVARRLRISKNLAYEVVHSL